MEYMDTTSKLIKYNAEAGNAHAQYLLGNMYYDGEGVEINYEMAFKLYQQSARQGNSDALNMLAGMYLNNFDGVKQDCTKAYDLFEQSAKQGNVLAQNMLHQFLHRGHDMNINTEIDLANKGNPDAQRVIAIRYYNGNGLEEDIEEAVKWFERAAKQGDTFSLLQAGLIYSSEYGNVKKAQYFLEEAVNKGNKLATFALKDLEQETRKIKKKP